MTLTSGQKAQVIAQEPRKSATYIFNLIVQYDNLSLADFPAMDPRKKAAIQTMLDNLPPAPNAQEQQEWSTLDANYPSSFAGSDDAALATLAGQLQQYISHWEPTQPLGNSVALAKQRLAAVEYELQQRRAQQAEAAWANIDKTSLAALQGFLRQYPSSPYQNDVDDAIWALTDKGNASALSSYLSLFPQGQHSAEAQQRQQALTAWQQVNTDDIFAVHDYLCDNPHSPLRDVVQQTLDDLKEEEVWQMTNNAPTYSLYRVRDLINDGIFTTQELVDAGVATAAVLDAISRDATSPDSSIAAAIDRAGKSPSCKDGYTDVYFFGVPSTGKTCILMGLMSSGLLAVNNTTASGDYADQLKRHATRGVVVGRTQGTFTTTIEATMYEPNNTDIRHGINLVEMSGEEFAFHIARNPRGTVRFEHMGGSKAAQLLNNNNRKLFFLIIDPTVTTVSIDREEEQVDANGNPVLDETGQPVKVTVTAAVDQSIILQKMINLFNNPGNKATMQKVDTLHIIVTKADTLGADQQTRDERAMEVFRATVGNALWTQLCQMCEDYNINSNSNFTPKLYTFSLGKFGIGGLFSYDATDTDRIVKAIRNGTQRIKKPSWWDKFKEKVNG